MSGPIREATPADAPALDVIRQQAMEAGFTDHYPRSAFADLVAAPDERLRDRIGAPDTLVLVVEADVTLASFGAYEVPSARIVALYTAPEYQDEGRASALLGRFERRAREDGKDRLHATVPLNAVGFFERRGFERRGTTERQGLSMVEVARSV